MGTTIAPNPDLDNTTFAVPENYPNRGYDVNNTYSGKPLKDVLAQQGFAPANTTLTMVGTMVDMCVLTSVLHARSLGYAVDVYEPGLNGDSPASDWCLPLPGSNEPMPKNWLEKLYRCQGSAGRSAALQYM